MKLAAIILLAIQCLFAVNDEKKIQLIHIHEPVQIDGKLDSVWSIADSIEDFVQHKPYNNRTPSRKTVAKLLTTDDALFALIICYDEEKNIQKNLGKLDDFGGDVVSIMLDTFGDKRTAYKFAVSASGVRADCRLLDDARNRDYSWDGLWFSDSKIYDWGYVVEIEIPYKSIKFNENLRAWGLDFDRWIPARSEDIYWCAYEENEGQRISKFGNLIFNSYRPSGKGLNLEVYPVLLSKANYLHDNKYKIDPNVGLDLFFNPSSKFTFQLTANPDFAQIEADPYDFNITRYESYFEERRPFFTEGREIFMPSGKERGSGFYNPLELFYSRRVGRKLPDGREVPIILGTRAFGRLNSLEYGGFVAKTAATNYKDIDIEKTEAESYFGAARLKKQILDNSSIGFLYATRMTGDSIYGVFDIDGAFRSSEWQLAYQVARSYKNGKGDYAGTAGFSMTRDNWITLLRGRYVGNQFDVDQIGFVPWQGNAQFVGISGPRWYFKNGDIQEISLYTGGILNYEKPDAYTDYGGLIGLNMQFRKNWGFEYNLDFGKSKESKKKYTAIETSISTWFRSSPNWSLSFDAGYSKTYNFTRDYLAYYSWIGGDWKWNTFNFLEVGTSYDIFIEGAPDNRIEETTYNTRPYFSFTPVNDLNLRMYVDNVFLQSSKKFENLIFGFLFSYNYSPKSWIYFAVNEMSQREASYDIYGMQVSNKMQILDRAAVIKLSYLYSY